MNKKTMLVAFAVVASMLALPSLASAQLMTVHNGGNTTISGHGGEGKLTAAGEPTITCETTTVSGKWGASGATTGGTISLNFKGCHINVFFTIKCRTTGSTLDNEIVTAGSFHTIKTGTGKPAVLVTPNATTVLCGGSTIDVSGSVIGTVTKPACNTASTSATLAFNETNNVQEHNTYTGVAKTLFADTTNGEGLKAASLQAEATLTFGAANTLTC